MVQAWAALAAGQPLERFEYDPGPLGPEEVEVTVETCGICHSDVSVVRNDWGISTYPVVPGHEVIGRVAAMGPQAKGLTVGQRVGIGWSAESCMHCPQCLAGDGNLCAENVATIVGHYGGFADSVRAQWQWVIPVPEALEARDAGPLLCGGTTVFAPFHEYDISPTHHVGVVGIGGLGHLALKFAKAWGCEVTAFTSTDSKADEARSFGADHVVNSRDRDTLRGLARTLDLLLVTVNVTLDWPSMIGMLAPRGRMHMVGAVIKPMPVIATDLIAGQRSISGSPTAGPLVISKMLDFSARHAIAPQTEHFPMDQVNDALEHLKAGNARYRIVLDA
ncbi:MAG: NAD(P)-dependent alcohol dehydrogenase [Methyloceanibacter sp.]|nr:NAD(P)-dependent alcohol dehydrogenase [Methyloceanibacter sp.]